MPSVSPLPVSPLIGYAVFALFVLTVGVHLAQQRSGSPVTAIFTRWLRWLTMTAGLPWALLALELSTRPFWVLAVVSGLAALLVETAFNWVMIHAINTSPLPLFPRFQINQSGDEWPTQPRLLQVRDWLRSQGFHQAQALRAEVGSGLYLRLSVYEDAKAETRIQITFLPQPAGVITTCYSVHSITLTGHRYVTDNLFLPFGGFYPEHWLVERNPWRRSLPGLVARHRARLTQRHDVATPFPTPPLDELNLQQKELDALNTELGFLLPPPEREEHGKISSEGRYRVWKEILLLNYFGRSARY